MRPFGWLALAGSTLASGALAFWLPPTAWGWATAALGVPAALAVRQASGPPRRLLRLGRGVRTVRRGVTNNHGHADWMTMREARRRFPGPARGYGGVVVGEAYRVDLTQRGPFDPADPRTWGQGGRARLLIDPCTDGPTHGLMFAGSGGFKTVSAVTTILHWTGASVILDPSCEVGPMVRPAMEARGKTVHFLDPVRPADAERWGFNALDWIDTKDPLAEMHVFTVVAWIFSEPTANETEAEQFFRGSGMDLVACLLAHLLWDDAPGAPKTLAALSVGLATPEGAMRDLLRGIYRRSHSRMARHLAGTLMEIVDETFSSVCAKAAQETRWMSIAAFSDLVSGDAFCSADVAEDVVTVFVQISVAALIAKPAVGRVIIGALLNAVYLRKEAGDRVLFLLDEVARLGRMKVLEIARDLGRKYGITLLMLYQSVGQLEEQWGRGGKRAWYEGVSWRAYSAIQDPETALELSKACGGHGVLAYSEGENAGRQSRGGPGWGSRSTGANTNTHEIARPLIRPEELTQDTRLDEMFLITRGCKPLRCGRPIYFRRPELRAVVQPSLFAGTPREGGPET